MVYVIKSLFMTAENKHIWEKPEVKELGDAKEIIKGFAPADPKVSGGGDSDLDVASDL